MLIYNAIFIQLWQIIIVLSTTSDAFWFTKQRSSSLISNTNYPTNYNNLVKSNETINRESFRKLEYISNNLNGSNINESITDGLKGQNVTGDLNSVIDIVFKYLQKNNTQDLSINGDGNNVTGGTGVKGTGIPIQMTADEAERNKAILKNVIVAISQTWTEYKQEIDNGPRDPSRQNGANKANHPIVHYMVKVLSRILAAFDGSPQAGQVEAQVQARLRRGSYDALLSEIVPTSDQSADGSVVAKALRRAVAELAPTDQPSTRASGSDVAIHKKPTPKQVWGYAIMFVTIICFCALTGALFLSFMKKKYYKMMLQFMIGLAVGSLSGSAVFHLIPQAFNLLENDVHHSYINKSGTMIGGIYLFLVTEWLIKIFLEKRRAKKMAQEEERLAHKTVALVGPGGVDDTVPEFKKRNRFLVNFFGSCCSRDKFEVKQAHRSSSSPLANGSAPGAHNNHKGVQLVNGNVAGAATTFTQLRAHEMEKELDRDTPMAPEEDLNVSVDSNPEDTRFCQISALNGGSGGNEARANRLRAYSCSSVHGRKIGHGHVENGKKRHISLMPTTYDYDDDNAPAITITPDEMIKTCSHEEGLHFAGQNTVVTLAYMILLGDGLHNFIDGLSIGAAFAQSILSGVSISLAVIFEEFPHELGDFAILINSGMSVKKAMLCNFVSASTCYLGMFFGILLGENEQISFYIFALAAGMFLYISLVDMMPELNKSIEKANKMGSLTSTLVIQYTGVAIGLTSMCILAKYASEISF